MQAINFSEARSHFKDLLDTVIENVEATIIKRRGSEDAVVMSLDHYNSLMETVHLLHTPANAAHLAESIAQRHAGELLEKGLVDAE